MSKEKRILSIFMLAGLLALPHSHALAQTTSPPPAIKIIHSSGHPSLSLPLACTYGNDCWVMNYPDIGQENDGKAIDSGCLGRTYEGHKGTDFTIKDVKAMQAGVDVLAAYNGTVLRLRDGEADRLPTKEELETAKNSKKECGNGVLIDHGEIDGAKWQSMYCHMKKGAIAVKIGQQVKTGEKIGEVGLSGITQYPHLHIGITKDGKVVDPFTGQDTATPCGQSNRSPLWSSKTNLHYDPLAIGAHGFTNTPPTLAGLTQQSLSMDRLPSSAPSLLFYATMWGLREGDDIALEIISPSKNVFAERVIKQDKNRARQLYFVGREKLENDDFEKGEYTGRIKIKRTTIDGKSQLFTKDKKLIVQ